MIKFRAAANCVHSNYSSEITAQQVGDCLPGFISFCSQPALTYLTRQAQRREIKSKDTLIALADVTGQGVTDKTGFCSLYISLANCCYRCKRSLSFHQSQCVTHACRNTCRHTHIQKHTTNWPPALGRMYWSRVGKYGSVSRKVVISVMVSRCDTVSGPLASLVRFNFSQYDCELLSH